MDSSSEKPIYVPDSQEKLASLPRFTLSRSKKNKRVITGRLSKKSILKHKNKKADPHIPHTITTEMDSNLSSKHAEVINANSTITSAVKNNNNDDHNNDLPIFNISSDSSPSHSQDWAIKPEMNSNNFTISEFDPLDTRKPSGKSNNQSNSEIMDAVIIDSSDDSDDEKPYSLQFEEDGPDINSNLVWQTSKTECLRNQFTQNMECIIPSSESDSTTSETIIVDSASVRSTPEDSVIEIVSLSQDSEIQISEPTPPSNMFSVHSQPNVILLKKPNINAHGPYYDGNLTWVFDDNLIYTLKSLFCVLTEKKLICYTDSSRKILKEVYNLDNVTSVHTVKEFDS